MWGSKPAPLNFTSVVELMRDQINTNSAWFTIMFDIKANIAAKVLTFFTTENENWVSAILTEEDVMTLK